MKRGEVAKKLNVIIEATDTLIDSANMTPRHKQRLDAIRDQVFLLALDLRLPLQPVEGKADVAPERQAKDNPAG